MRSAALVLLFAVATALTGCPESTHGDAGVDVQPLPRLNFEETSPTGDAGPPMCTHGDLYNYASQGMATCMHPMEACVATAPPSTILCTCDAADGGLGFWVCRMP
jgi:hypothetical protein